MFSILDFDLPTRVSSALFWAWIIASVMLALGLGFLAGVAYANRATDRGIRKASKTLTSLYALVLDSLENSRRIVALLENFPKVALTKEQVEQLDTKRGFLTEIIGRLIGTQRDALAKQVETQAKPKSKTKPIKLTWQRGTFDAHTNLPDRTAFDVNLRKCSTRERGPRCPAACCKSALIGSISSSRDLGSPDPTPSSRIWPR